MKQTLASVKKKQEVEIQIRQNEFICLTQLIREAAILDQCENAPLRIIVL